MHPVLQEMSDNDYAVVTVNGRFWFVTQKGQLVRRLDSDEIDVVKANCEDFTKEVQL